MKFRLGIYESRDMKGVEDIDMVVDRWKNVGVKVKDLEVRLLNGLLCGCWGF